MSDHIQQAADVMASHLGTSFERERLAAARALADVGLLKCSDDVIVTREELDIVAQRLRDEYDPLKRAVLDAAVATTDASRLPVDRSEFAHALVAQNEAVDALRAATTKVGA